MRTLIPFFRFNLGSNPRPSLARRFNPSYPNPAGLASETARAPVVEIEVASSRPFAVGGALATLVIDERSFTLSRYPSGSTDRLVFTLESRAFEALSQGAEVSLRVGGARVWNLGPPDKALAH